MCRVWKSFHTCWFSLNFIWILKLRVIVAVRFSHLESDPTEMPGGESSASEGLQG